MLVSAIFTSDFNTLPSFGRSRHRIPDLPTGFRSDLATLSDVETVQWHNGVDPVRQLRAIVDLAAEPGLIVIRFSGGPPSASVTWNDIEPLTRGRAVTVSLIEGDLDSPGLDIALVCDLVLMDHGATIALGKLDQPQSPGTLWALARAGRAALARGLLDDGRVAPEEAVRLGLAHEVVDTTTEPPLPNPSSLTALTAARDLLRSRASGEAGRALELATFRLLFASGDPEEGARAFLERRAPDFPANGD